ncbi:ferredoxin [Planctomyces bekefii]|uniref:Ferredoxin n=1 Tax=Planctomyces bekefii TaxID=1653850 RepID=A0A5C6MH48_9PLAN|nr:ferredoxin [Planctomyces bekefii]
MSLEIRFLDATAPLEPGQTVLDALDKAGVTIPSSCRAGACQSCLLRLTDGAVPSSAQAGIRESLRLTGHFLSCICKPTQSIACEPASVVACRTLVSIREIQAIGPDVALVRFERPSAFAFTAGQFVTLKREDGLARSYSLASSAEHQSHFDIHVRRVGNGRMSGWFHDQARPRDQLWMEGPKGDCMYYPGQPDEPLTLVGTGTGIAPLYAIAVDAVRKGHTGPIAIYHGGVSPDRLYFVNECESLASANANVRYLPCVIRGEVRGEVRVGDLKQFVISELSETKKGRVYLCGDPSLVNTLKKLVFLAGVSLSRIHADPFIGTEAG